MCKRLTQLDELNFSDHYHLDSGDRCYFLGEYTARKGYAFSASNQLVLNLKKAPDRKANPHEWKHKLAAIRAVAKGISESVDHAWLQEVTFVPMPPSKCKEDPLYDDRICAILNYLQILVGHPLDIRDILVQEVSTEAVHDLDDRPTIQELISRYKIAEEGVKSTPKLIVIVDDVLTTGAHFKAASSVLRTAYPDVEMIGFFAARRVPEADDFETILASFQNLESIDF